MRSRKMNHFFCTCLAAIMLLSGCGGAKEASTESVGPASGEVTVETEQEETIEEAAETGAEEEFTTAIPERDTPDWVADAVLYEVNLRQYTEEGTFAAFGEHLDELKAAGFNTLWFMPIHPIAKKNRAGGLGSYYSVADYQEVNPDYGTKEDFKALVDAAHEKGFHVMLDWVGNHTGWDNPWIEEHPDWYTTENGKIISPAGTGWLDVADLNYDSAAMRKEMIKSMSYWVTEFDIDGFRCDYAPGVPADFWETARYELQQIKPLFFLEEDLGWANKDLLTHAFDCNYNSKVYEHLVLVANGAKSSDFLKLYFPKDIPEGTFVMNYLGNHDTNSYDRTVGETFGEEQLPAFFALAYALPGVPMVYSGDEVANDNALEFMEKDPIDWESTGRDYRELLGILSRLRIENAPLQTGSYAEKEFTTLPAGDKEIFAFQRKKDGKTVTGIFNLSGKPHEANLTDIVKETDTLLLHGAGATYETDAANPAATTTLQPWEWYLLAE